MNSTTEIANLNCPPSNTTEHAPLNYKHNGEHAKSNGFRGTTLADAEAEHRERLALLVSRHMPSSLAAIYRTALGLWDNVMPRNGDRKAVGAALWEIADVVWGRNPRVKGWSAEGVLGIAGLQRNEGFSPADTTPSLPISASASPQCACPAVGGNSDVKGAGTMGKTRKVNVTARSAAQKALGRLRRLEELTLDEAAWLEAIYRRCTERIPEGLARMWRFSATVRDGVVPRDEDLRFFAEAFRVITASRFARPLPPTEPDEVARQRLTDQERRMIPKSLTIAAMLSTARGPSCDIEEALGINQPSGSPGTPRNHKYLRETIAFRVGRHRMSLSKVEAINVVARELEAEGASELERDPKAFRPQQGWVSFAKNCLNSLDATQRESVRDALEEARGEEWKVPSAEVDEKVDRAKRDERHRAAAIKARSQHGVAYAALWETFDNARVQCKWFPTEERAREFEAELRGRGAWVHDVWKS